MQLIDVFCIGNPNLMGDAVGPMVGSLLQLHKLDVNIVGTMDDPVIRSTLDDKLKLLRKDSIVIAIDAVLGDEPHTYSVSSEPIIPGAALGPQLQGVGNISVRCCTGTVLVDLLHMQEWEVLRLAYKITTDLLDLVRTSTIVTN